VGAPGRPAFRRGSNREHHRHQQRDSYGYTPTGSIARVYAALRDDVAAGTFTAPRFEHAVRFSHLVDDVQASAAGGRSITPTADRP